MNFYEAILDATAQYSLKNTSFPSCQSSGSLIMANPIVEDSFATLLAETSQIVSRNAKAKAAKDIARKNAA